MKKKKHNLRYLWKTKYTNMQIRVSEGEKRIERILNDIMIENFLNLMKDINLTHPRSLTNSKEIKLKRST